MTFNAGTSNAVINPILMRAMCQGRSAAVAGSLIGTCPYGNGTQQKLYWVRGFNTYKSTGSVTYQDGCAELAKYTPPALTATLDEDDETGKTFDFATDETLPCIIQFGDGAVADSEDGTASHTYNEYGTYTASVIVFDTVYSPISVEPTEPEE